MKRIIKKAAALILAVMVAVPVMSVPAAAATTLSVTGGDSVKGGEAFTLTITYSGGNVGRVISDVYYNTDVLTYIAGGSSLGNNGYVELKNAGTGEDIVFNLKFQALKEGETTVKVETREMYDLNEMEMSNISASKKVSITGDADKNKLMDPEMAPDDEDPADIGVDEKDDPVNFTMILAIGAGVVALLIIIIAVAIRRKK